ncbi:hypothetical protein BH10CHL1_BH10CHL1_32920 [soil metagenome]
MTLEQSPLTPYHTDHLFLLIGSNPLPNYIAARLLLKPDGKLYLVHSKDGEQRGTRTSTQNVAEALATLLHESYQIEASTRIPVDESNADDIYEKVTDALNALKARGSVGLHYTGGTKAMAVHAYRAVENFGKSNSQQTVFSYLDAASMSLSITGSGRSQLAPIPLDIWSRVSDGDEPSLSDLVKLHREQFDKTKTEDQVLIEFAKELAIACSKPNIAKQWRDWCDRVLRGRSYNRQTKQWETIGARKANDQDWQAETKLKQLTLDLPVESILNELLQNYLGVAAGGKLTLEQARQLVGFEYCADLCQWLDGEWLEYYVVECVRQCQQVDNEGRTLHDCLRSVRITGNSTQHDFELDVMAMSSYRFFGISCTTGMDMTKLKLFEAIIRGRQLGGDEARVAIIAPISPEKAEKYQREVNEDWQLGAPIRVFGFSDLPKLTDKLKPWFLKGA